jgi:Zn-dependent protease
VLWALAQPAAVLGLVTAFVTGTLVRAYAQWAAARLLRLPIPTVRVGIEPVGVIAAVLSGTGWGSPAPPARTGRGRLAVLAGPAAVLLTSQVVLGAYRETFPEDALILELNRPSDVLVGAITPTTTAQVLLSVGVGLLCFGLVALLPLPPMDGYRLLGLAPAGRTLEQLGGIALLLLLVVRITAQPPLIVLLDAVGGPVLRLWALV